MSFNPITPREPPPAPQRRLSRPLWVGGIALALAGGAFLGLAVQSDRGSISASKAEAAASPLQVELAAIPEPPKLVAGRLDVRPADAARAVSSDPPRIDLPRPEAQERQAPPSAGDDGAEEIQVPDFEPPRLERPEDEYEPLDDY